MNAKGTSNDVPFAFRPTAVSRSGFYYPYPPLSSGVDFELELPNQGHLLKRRV
jgi:hypothetical protein